MTEEQNKRTDQIVSAPKVSPDNRSHVASVWREREDAHLLIVIDSPSESFDAIRPLVLEAIYSTLERSSSPDTDTLRAALEEAHERVSTAAKIQNIDLGCSCALVLIKPKAVHIAHTGDIRICRVLAGRSLARLTRELSVPWFHGTEITQEGFLGQEGKLKAISPRTPIPISGDDLILVCTRSVWRHVPETTFLQCLSDYPLEDAIEQIVTLAREQGAKGITAICASRPPGEFVRTPTEIHIPTTAEDLAPLAPPSNSIHSARIDDEPKNWSLREQPIIGVAGISLILILAWIMWPLAGNPPPPSDDLTTQDSQTTRNVTESTPTAGVPRPPISDAEKAAREKLAQEKAAWRTTQIQADRETFLANYSNDSKATPSLRPSNGEANGETMTPLEKALTRQSARAAFLRDVLQGEQYRDLKKSRFPKTLAAVSRLPKEIQVFFQAPPQEILEDDALLIQHYLAVARKMEAFIYRCAENDLRRSLREFDKQLTYRGSQDHVRSMLLAFKESNPEPALVKYARFHLGEVR